MTAVGRKQPFEISYRSSPAISCLNVQNRPKAVFGAVNILDHLLGSRKPASQNQGLRPL